MLRRGILRLPAEDALQMFDDRMKGARRVKRRTADRHPNVILAGRLPQPFHQAGLAEPGFTLDQHDLAAAMATAVPGPQQQPHLLLAPDERSALPARFAANQLSNPRRQDTPRGTARRTPSAQAPRFLEVEVVAERRTRRRADDGLVQLRPCLQTAVRFGVFADDRGFRCRPSPIFADDHQSGGDADPNHELDPGGRRPWRSAPSSQQRYREPPRRRSASSSWARDRRNRPDAVAHVLRDKAIVAPNVPLHRLFIEAMTSRGSLRSIPVEGLDRPGRRTSRSAGGARLRRHGDRGRRAAKPAIRARWRGQAASRRAARLAVVGTTPCPRIGPGVPRKPRRDARRRHLRDLLIPISSLRSSSRPSSSRAKLSLIRR